MNEKHNGWANYETWRVNLEIFDGYEPDEHEFKDVDALAEALEERADEAITNYGEIKEPSLALDYARSFLSEVDYHEIAESIVKNYPNCIEEA